MVQADQPLDACLGRLGKVVISGVLVGEERVAALTGHFDRVQQRRAGRYLEIRIIRMEISARILQADRLAVLPAIGQDQDVGMLGMMELVDDMRLGWTESTGKFEELQ